jgi:hypothetical protein
LNHRKQGFLDYFEGSEQSLETFGMIQVVGGMA